MLMVFMFTISTSIRAATPDLEKSSKTEFVKATKSETVANATVLIVNVKTINLKEPAPVIRQDNFNYTYTKNTAAQFIPDKKLNYRQSFYQRE